MLVLTRKIGQQVVLPEQGITIDVMEVGKTRVRLGISAPAEVPVHRREVWDRACDAGNARPDSDDSAPVRVAADEPQSRTASSPSFADLGQCLAQWITRRTGGRMSELSVERLDGRIVIQGSARSYHVRQLAQAAVNEVLSACDLLSAGCVEYNIDVAQVYWRSNGHTRGLTRLRGGGP
jgi:carbon storage regulator